MTTLFTPSYRGDLDRARWMRRSVQRFLAEPCPHFIAVPREDIPRFRAAFREDPDVTVVCQRDAVDPIFYPHRAYRALRFLLPSQAWRLNSHAGRPGWVVQQIVKLNCLQWVEPGPVVFVDSDLVFTRPFTPTDLGIRPDARTLVRITPPQESSRHRKHISAARELLALPAGTTEHHYMAYPAVWYTDWLEALLEKLERQWDRPWQLSVHATQVVSEYSIYGCFVEEVLRPAELAVRTVPFHEIVADRSAYDALRGRYTDGTIGDGRRLSLVIQSNLSINPRDYEDILRLILAH